MRSNPPSPRPDGPPRHAPAAPRYAARLALVVLLALPLITSAAPIENLQRARVAVPDQSDAARRSALGEALGDVLIRLTGRPTVGDEPAVAELVAEPTRFVQRYHYEQQGEKLLLVAKFDGQALREALVRRDIPIWQAGRPRVLTWLAVESGGERWLVEADATVAAGERFRDRARELGVALFYPLLDLQDRNQVRYTDVAGGFSQPVLAASRRYGASVVLIGRLREADGWTARWTLYGVEDAPVSWQGRGAESQAVMDAAVGELAKVLRQHYAGLPDLRSSGQSIVRIGNVTELADFAAAKRLLADAPGVDAVELYRIDADVVSFRLALSIPASRLETVLDGLSALTRQPAAEAAAGAGSGPSYRLGR